MKGLVILNRRAKPGAGMNRPLKLAAQSLAEQDIELIFVSSDSISDLLRICKTLLKGLILGGSFKYKFILFNSLASLHRSNRFGCLLAEIILRFNLLPLFIYWHESDWTLNKYAKESPEHFSRIDKIASSHRVFHLLVSSFCKKSILDRYANANVEVIYNCAEVPVELGFAHLPAQPLLVVNIASIQERKGTDLFVETAIKVCRKHPTVEFVWIGSGNAYGTWKKQIEVAGLEQRIIFPGAVNPPYLVLRYAALLFLSSRDDPFPLAVLEAMGFGKKVITFDVGGAPEALNELGTVVPPFDTDAAAAAILDKLNQPLDQFINSDLQQRYFELFTPEKFATRLSSYLKQHITS